MKILFHLSTLLCLTSVVGCDSGEVAPRDSNSSGLSQASSDVEDDEGDPSEDSEDTGALDQFKHDLENALGDQLDSSRFDDDPVKEIPLKFDPNASVLIRNRDFSDGTYDGWRVTDSEKIDLTVSQDDKKRLRVECAGTCEDSSSFSQSGQFDTEPDWLQIGFEHQGESNGMRILLNVQFSGQPSNRSDAGENLESIDVSSSSKIFAKNFPVPPGATHWTMLVKFETSDKVFFFDDFWVQGHQVR